MAEPEAQKPIPKPVVPPPKSSQKIIRPLAPKHRSKGLVVGGVAFLVILGIGGFFLIQWANRPPSVPVVLTPPPSELPLSPAAGTEAPADARQSAETSSPFSGTFRSGSDTDSDGLTDVEEVEIYRSDVRLPDTDKDGFLDGNEVFNGYDPIAAPPQTLLQGGLAKEFSVASPIPLVLWHPMSWSLVQDQTVPSDQLFVSTTGERFRFSMKPKETGQSLSDWYAAQGISGAPRASLTKKGLAFVVGESQLSAFVDLGENVAVFMYEPGVKGTLEYLQTFQMMVNSLAAVKE